MHFSDWTSTKNEVVCGIFKWLTIVGRSVMDRYPNYRAYHYLDMNAADGSGSPTFFHDAAQRAGLPFHALFIENDARLYNDLYGRFKFTANVETVCEDHETAALRYCRVLTGKPYGLIYNDPCGIPSFDTLTAASQLPQLEHMDILINCPATAIKRKRGAFKSADYLIPELYKIRKSHWLVRAPAGRWQWTILLGTNWRDVQEWRAQKLYHIDSSAGQEILKRLNLTSVELEAENGQSPLPLI